MEKAPRIVAADSLTASSKPRMPNVSSPCMVVSNGNDAALAGRAVPVALSSACRLASILFEKTIFLHANKWLFISHRE